MAPRGIQRYRLHDRSTTGLLPLLPYYSLLLYMRRYRTGSSKFCRRPSLLCYIPAQHRSDAASNRSRLSRRLAAVSYPRCCSQPDYDRGCSTVANLAIDECRKLACHVQRSSVLMKNEALTHVTWGRLKMQELWINRHQIAGLENAREASMDSQKSY